jgi:hypothetical protein
VPEARLAGLHRVHQARERVVVELGGEDGEVPLGEWAIADRQFVDLH